MNLKHLLVIVATVLMIVATGCSSRQNQPNAPATETPLPISYQYEYEIVNTRTECEPDMETWLRLYTALNYGDLASDVDMDEVYAEGAEIANCTAENVQDYISRRGENGWRLIAFEALQPQTYDLGVEYSYRMIWERQP